MEQEVPLQIYSGKLRAPAQLFRFTKLTVKGGENGIVDFESPNFVRLTITGKHNI